MLATSIGCIGRLLLVWSRSGSVGFWPVAGGWWWLSVTSESTCGNVGHHRSCTVRLAATVILWWRILFKYRAGMSGGSLVSVVYYIQVASSVVPPIVANIGDYSSCQRKNSFPALSCCYLSQSQFTSCWVWRYPSCCSKKACSIPCSNSRKVSATLPNKQ